ncbi:MAG: hypothetical protein A2275_17055 [Bacteroidetes bacterium RIFOXYA12_FULL_35_11]|nr:MAG: hypothetical protein A2X01_18190 [Bacteroidetes bacterium GWF2_35_48]OFY83398.1 MAG: hypothetical protein A2275_17055 [Bacteroidetes bacterium RIFOXYA12_FULL_35_11]OFY95325.1 MAG: hypothetical protein A2309_13200 [Bacteroidetes bacterium RIFOXYB2_FULL_35_7]OFZ01683.1 MAG: hypothetical protein A2491_01510 [Bacteroidetes bacterium RIFOXYC12_FULL_35_7]
MVLRSKGIIEPIYIFFLLTRPSVLTNLQKIAEGRSGTFPQITFTELKEVTVFVPKEATHPFLKLVKNAYDQIFQNEIENRQLIKTRDMLLPKLISGEIPINVE